MVRSMYTHHRIALHTFEFLYTIYILLIFKTLLIHTKCYYVAHIRKKNTYIKCIHSLPIIFKKFLRISSNRVSQVKTTH